MRSVEVNNPNEFSKSASITAQIFVGSTAKPYCVCGAHNHFVFNGLCLKHDFGKVDIQAVRIMATFRSIGTTE